MSKREPIDHGTKEIARKFTIVPKLSGPNGYYHDKVMDETEIDRMLLRGDITPNHHASLEGLLRRLTRVGFGIKSPTYDGAIHMDPARVGDKRAAALRGIVKIFKRMDDKMGAVRRRSLVDLVLLDTPWPGDGLHEAIRQMDDAIAGR